MTWSPDNRDLALKLASHGMSDRRVAEQLGIPRATVGYWRRGGGNRRLASAQIAQRTGWRPTRPALYAYLLGLYLGDGHLVRASANSVRLVITLDSTYDAIVDETRAAMAGCFPDRNVCCVLRMGGSCKALQLSHPDLLAAFPQHGPGRKHEREIVLAEWQSEITRAHPRELLRGLIQSDGCRTMNRFRTRLPSGRIAEYEYPRYFFSNLSADIRAIFCEHCELLGVRWTQSNPRNISVSHRRSVALLDEFVGPKR